MKEDHLTQSDIIKSQIWIGKRIINQKMLGFALVFTTLIAVFCGASWALERQNSIKHQTISQATMDQQAGIWKMVEDQRDALYLAEEKQRNMTRTVNHQKETQKALFGFITGYTNYLEDAKVINPDRPDGFPFRDWHPHIVDKMLKIGLLAFHIDVLRWVTQQPDWKTIVSEKRVNEIELFIKEYAYKKQIIENLD